MDLALTREKKIETIRSAAIAANPEIVELKFGCRFRDKGFTYTLNNVVEENNHVYDHLHYRAMSGEDKFHYRFQLEKKEIIGREIGIADVLLAMDTKEYKLEKYGDFLFFTDNVQSRSWNLHKTLEDQDPSVIDFILQVLFVV